MDVAVDATLQNACGIDIKTHCSDIDPGHGRRITCLVNQMKHKPDTLQEECLEKLQERQGMWNKARQIDGIGALAVAVTESNHASKYFLKCPRPPNFNRSIDPCSLWKYLRIYCWCIGRNFSWYNVLWSLHRAPYFQCTSTKSALKCRHSVTHKSDVTKCIVWIDLKCVTNPLIYILPSVFP